MKLFVLLRRYYELLGICPVQNSFNLRNCLTLLFVVHFSITSAVYLIVEAKTIQECMDSFYTFATATANVFDMYLIIRNTVKNFQLIDNLEQAIQRRNLQTIYNKLNEKIEKFCKNLHFIYVQCTLIGIMMPNFVTTFFNYFFTTDGDAFRLPLLAT